MITPILVGRAHAGDIITHHRPGEGQLQACGLRTTRRGGTVRVALLVPAGETSRDSDARVRRELDELEAIDETVTRETWSRCDGEVPSPAEHWHRRKFRDADVVAWLEAGVPWAAAAADLRDLQIEPREVAGEWSAGTSLGLAYARELVSLVEVWRLLGRKEVSHG